MAPTPSPSVSTRSRAVKERQLAIVEDPAREIQTVDDREIQVDDDWEDKLNLQVKIMYVESLCLCVCVCMGNGVDCCLLAAAASTRELRYA